MKGLVLAIALLLAGCVGVLPLDHSPATLTPEHFAASVVIKNDSLDVEETLSTVNGFQDRRSQYHSDSFFEGGRSVRSDKFLVALVDKKTGKTRYRLHHYLAYTGLSENYNSVVFETVAGPRTDRLEIVKKGLVTCKGMPPGKCIHFAEFYVDLEESVLRWAASLYVAGENRTWRYKLGTKGLGERQEQLLYAEIAGLLAAVDSYRKERGFK